MQLTKTMREYGIVSIDSNQHGNKSYSCHVVASMVDNSLNLRKRDDRHLEKLKARFNPQSWRAPLINFNKTTGVHSVDG